MARAWRTPPVARPAVARPAVPRSAVPRSARLDPARQRGVLSELRNLDDALSRAHRALSRSRGRAPPGATGRSLRAL